VIGTIAVNSPATFTGDNEVICTAEELVNAYVDHSPPDGIIGTVIGDDCRVHMRRSGGGA